MSGPDAPRPLYRVGSKAGREAGGIGTGRTIYRQAGPAPAAGDVLVGCMDTPELAAAAVLGLNAFEVVESVSPAEIEERLQQLHADVEYERVVRRHCPGIRLLGTSPVHTAGCCEQFTALAELIRVKLRVPPRQRRADPEMGDA